MKRELTSSSFPCNPFWTAPDTRPRRVVQSTRKCSCVRWTRAWRRQCKSTGTTRGCPLEMASHRAASGHKSPCSNSGYNSGGWCHSCCLCGCIGHSVLLLTRRLPDGFRNPDQLQRENVTTHFAGGVCLTWFTNWGRKALESFTWTWCSAFTVNFLPFSRSKVNCRVDRQMGTEWKAKHVAFCEVKTFAVKFVHKLLQASRKLVKICH